MISLTIDPTFKARVPTLTVGFITAQVRNSEHNEALWREIDTAAKKFEGMTMDEVRQYPRIKSLREAYRRLGNDPTRYRGASEALIRRIVQGKDLYHVHTVVDICNLVALESLFSTEVFDLETIQPPVLFRLGQPGETYFGIGRGEIKLKRLPVFADILGPFGCTTNDSERTMVRLESSKILMVVISFMGNDDMKVVLQRASELLEKYAGAMNVELGVVE
jgi:DNA/RNA-binding domain of Phe-tRNA-synthetase-like protein